MVTRSSQDTPQQLVTMSSEGSVFDLICAKGENQNKNIQDLFLKHSADVFAHVYSDIVNFLETLEFATLINIRKTLFENLNSIIPLNEYDLITRRKKSILEDDIFVLGYSLVSESEHKRLNKVLKAKVSAEDENPEANEVNLEDSHADLTWLAPFTDMKTSMRQLKELVKELRQRVDILEAEITVQKLENEKLSKSKSNNNVGRPNQITVVADVHHDPTVTEDSSNEVASQKVPDEVFNDSDCITVLEDDSKPDEVFRHTKQQRKNILKKPRAAVAQVTKGLSDKSKCKIRAATSKKSGETLVPSGTKLVYVGNLSEDSDEHMLRSHLIEIGIQDDDIADIIRLNNRYNRFRIHSDKSFCVSLNNDKSEKIALAQENWPSGVRIRKYFQRQSGNGTFGNKNLIRENERGPLFIRDYIKYMYSTGDNVFVHGYRSRYHATTRRY